ncbi:MAG: autotransporter domain-containing protein [Devosia sp.]
MPTHILHRGRLLRGAHLPALLLGTALASVSALAAPGAELLTFNGSFAGDDSSANKISANGLVVVGQYQPGVNAHAYRWDGTTLQDLGTLGGATSNASDVSADGAVVVGRSETTVNGTRPFRWSGGPMVDLGSLGGISGGANAVSADGAVVVGTSNLVNDIVGHAFRWTGAGMVDLGTLGGADPFGDFSSYATDVSADGTVVVGASTYTIGQTNKLHAFRWTAGTGMVDLSPTLTGTSSSANAVSADGTVIVGGIGGRAALWRNGVVEDLGTLPGHTDSTAFDVSADGKVVVGHSDGNGAVEAVRWTAATGIKSIKDLLTESGVDMTGWKLVSANGVSGDGTVIVGTGRNPTVETAYIVRCTANCAIIDAATASRSFAGLGGMGATGSAFLGGELEAAGDMAENGKASPLTGFAYGAFDSDPTTSATVGATYNLGDDLIIGGSLGVAGIQTLMPYSGSSTFYGPSATAFIASRPDSGFNWLAGGAALALNGTVTRGYLNGNTPVTSTGSTTGSGAGFNAEAGWSFADLLTDTLVTPFVNVSVSSMSYAGYTETGGPFPATFAPFTTLSAIVRVGVDGRYEFRKDSYLSASVSYGHNFGNGGTIAGTIPGILALSVPGDAPVADFVEASVGLDLPVTEAIRFSGRLGAVLPFAGTPSVQARAGLSMAF